MAAGEGANEDYGGRGDGMGEAGVAEEQARAVKVMRARCGRVKLLGFIDGDNIPEFTPAHPCEPIT